MAAQSKWRGGAGLSAEDCSAAVHIVDEGVKNEADICGAGGGTAYFAGVAMCAAVAIAPARAQNSIETPAGQKAVLTVNGYGVQIYACKDTSGSAQWVFQAPEAKLLDAVRQRGGYAWGWAVLEKRGWEFGEGPSGGQQQGAECGGYCVLLLKASGHEGDGVMSKVEYIRRTESHGGAAPAGGCDAGHLNATIRVAYSATYTFYAAQ